MSQTIVIAGDASNGSQIQSGNDGTVVIQSGLAGAKVNALSIAANGNMSLPASAAPCFSAYQSGAAQSIPNAVYTKIQFNTKEFDITNAYDAATNFRFQPLVAGYYQVNAEVLVSTLASPLVVSIYKNSAEFKRGIQVNSVNGGVVSSIVFMNGTTDYLEIFAYQASGAANALSSGSGVVFNYFNAAMIRPA